MSVEEIITEIKTMPPEERSEFYNILLSNKEVREDLLDILTIENRRGEESAPIDEVFKKLDIDA